MAQILLEILSTLAAGSFAGAAVYITLVEHPARLECGADLGSAEFKVSYRRGANLMGSLIVGGGACAAAVWLLGASGWWLIGGSLLWMLIPFTLIFVLPINKRLLATAGDVDSKHKLLIRWGRLHALRGLVGLTSFLIFVYLLAR